MIFISVFLLNSLRLPPCAAYAAPSKRCWIPPPWSAWPRRDTATKAIRSPRRACRKWRSSRLPWRVAEQVRNGLSCLRKLQQCYRAYYPWAWKVFGIWEVGRRYQSIMLMQSIRRSDGLILAQPPLPAELHKAIKQISGHSISLWPLSVYRKNQFIIAVQWNVPPTPLKTISILIRY